MICTNCGKEIQDGASFCPYCGALFADGLVRIHYEAQLESSAETLPVYNAETVRAAWDRQKATIGDDLSAKLDQMAETPYNASTLSRTYFLHHWETMAVSPFANAFAFIDGSM